MAWWQLFAVAIVSGFASSAQATSVIYTFAIAKNLSAVEVGHIAGVINDSHHLIASQTPELATASQITSRLTFNSQSNTAQMLLRMGAVSSFNSDDVALALFNSTALTSAQVSVELNATFTTTGLALFPTGTPIADVRAALAASMNLLLSQITVTIQTSARHRTLLQAGYSNYTVTTTSSDFSQAQNSSLKLQGPTIDVFIIAFIRSRNTGNMSSLATAFDTNATTLSSRITSYMASKGLWNNELASLEIPTMFEPVAENLRGNLQTNYAGTTVLRAYSMPADANLPGLLSGMFRQEPGVPTLEIVDPSADVSILYPLQIDQNGSSFDLFQNDWGTSFLARVLFAGETQTIPFTYCPTEGGFWFDTSTTSFGVCAQATVNLRRDTLSLRHGDKIGFYVEALMGSFPQLQTADQFLGLSLGAINKVHFQLRYPMVAPPSLPPSSPPPLPPASVVAALVVPAMFEPVAENSRGNLQTNYAGTTVIRAYAMPADANLPGLLSGMFRRQVAVPSLEIVDPSADVSNLYPLQIDQNGSSFNLFQNPFRPHFLARVLFVGETQTTTFAYCSTEGGFWFDTSTSSFGFCGQATANMRRDTLILRHGDRIGFYVEAVMGSFPQLQTADQFLGLSLGAINKVHFQLRYPMVAAPSPPPSTPPPLPPAPVVAALVVPAMFEPVAEKSWGDLQANFAGSSVIRAYAMPAGEYLKAFLTGMLGRQVAVPSLEIIDPSADVRNLYPLQIDQNGSSFNLFQNTHRSHFLARVLFVGETKTTTFAYCSTEGGFWFDTTTSSFGFCAQTTANMRRDMLILRHGDRIGFYVEAVMAAFPEVQIADQFLGLSLGATNKVHFQLRYPMVAAPSPPPSSPPPLPPSPVSGPQTLPHVVNTTSNLILNATIDGNPSYVVSFGVSPIANHSLVPSEFHNFLPDDDFTTNGTAAPWNLAFEPVSLSEFASTSLEMFIMIQYAPGRIMIYSYKFNTQAFAVNKPKDDNESTPTSPQLLSGDKVAFLFAYTQSDTAAVENKVLKVMFQDFEMRVTVLAPNRR